MKNIIYSSLLLFSAIFLGACGGGTMPVNYSSAAQVRMNDSLEVVQNKIDFSDAKVMNYSDGDDNYTVFICKRNIAPPQVFIVLLHPATYDYFVYAFKNDKLYYWGNLDDFKRCDDDKVNVLGIRISNYLLQ